MSGGIREDYLNPLLPKTTYVVDRSQILQGMMASQETTSALVGNTLFLLYRHPGHWEKVHDEVIKKGEHRVKNDALFKTKVPQNILLGCKCQTA